MKIVILCGGKGTRLREETEFRPKALVAVGNKPILWHVMKLYSHYGFNDFILCLGYKGEMIKDYFLNYDELSHDFTLNLGSGKKEIHHYNNTTPAWNITFADTGLECETGSRIARIKKYIGDDEDFFMTYGDGVANVNIPALLQYHKEKARVVTVTGIKPPNPFGVLEVESGLVTSFAEKHQSKDWTNGGFFVCNKKMFDYLSDDGECIFEQGPLNQLSHQGQLAVYQHNDFWHCVDTLKHVEGLNSLYHKGTRPWMAWES
jgi:glucose-1-phosphate cytidylyltransferase